MPLAPFDPFKPSKTNPDQALIAFLNDHIRKLNNLVDAYGLNGTVLSVPGDLTVGDDLTVTDDVSVGGDIAVTGTVDGIDVSKLGTVVNTTALMSDYALAVNETAVVNITAASTPLNIAVEDGVYQMDLLFDSATFGADQNIDLQANNTTYAGEFLRVSITGDASIATDEVDVVESDEGEYELAVGTRPRCITARLVIDGMLSSVVSGFYGTTAGNRRLRQLYTWRDGSVAHTSLGTLSIGEVATGVLYVKRMA